MQTLRHVVAGTDFSEHACQALELAIDLASVAGARLTVVHVCELGVDGLDEQHLSRCHEALVELLARHRSRHVELTGVVRSGQPWRKLDNVAVEVGAGLIVVGRNGAGRSPTNALGSVANDLVRCASRPVLTVAGDFDGPSSDGPQT